jgi:hypothetical protein
MLVKVLEQNWPRQQTRPTASNRLPAWLGADSVSAADKLSMSTIQQQTVSANNLHSNKAMCTTCEC